ncbi:MFS general substrate transporter [Mycena sanguinolenta]|uniref:MFS general substrate transporter n=1 Tax=Mycena sanguinolenta TaxID=230812 RepID=A0A8H6X3V1_9AGAR|nr:MFS general substrate transporter [Mycena sanguinolenta]
MSPSHVSTERDALLPRNIRSRDEGKIIVKFLPVVVFASVCRGLSLFARYEYYHRWPAHSPSRRFDTWFQMGGVVLKVDMSAMALSIFVSFVSVGWWSAIGDRHGRKCVLLISILGSLLRDLIYLAVAQSELQEHGVVMALVIDGLLGGFVTFTGVAHAYISDASASYSSKTLDFCLLHAVTFVSFRLGAFLGYVAGYTSVHSNAAFGGSVFLAFYNMVYIYFLLPESLVPQSASLTPEDTPITGLKSAIVDIASPVTIFFRSNPWRSPLVCFALFAFSGSLAYGVLVETSVSSSNQNLTDLMIPSILRVVTWVCIVPAAAFFFKRTEHHDDHFLFAKVVALWSIAFALLAISIFGVWASILLWIWFKSPYPPGFFLYPLSVAAIPALYSAAVSLTSSDSERGALFGSLSVWAALGEYLSYYFAGNRVDIGYYWAWVASVLVFSFISLASQDSPIPDILP